MKPISYLKNVSWLPCENRLDLYFSDKIPEALGPISSAFCFCFLSDTEIVLARINDRLRIPGGRVESDELVENAVFREVLEETCCIINDPVPIGFQRITCNTSNSEMIAGRPYPVFIEQYFVANVKQTLPFIPQFEATDRQVISVSRATTIEAIQFQYSYFLFERAMSLRQSVSHRSSRRMKAI